MKRQFKAFLAGFLSTAIALPASVAFGGQSSDPVYHQAPPATPGEWQDAMTAIGAGLEPESAITSQFEEMRLYAVWLHSVWECAFGRALTPNDPYPTVQQGGMLADGVYDLHAHTGETASIELVRTSHVTRAELLDLLGPGMELDAAVLGFGTAYAQITGDGCTKELLVRLHHLEIDGVQRTVVFVGSVVSPGVFYAMKITTAPIPSFILQQPHAGQPVIDPNPGEVEPGPNPQPVCAETLCAQLARDKLRNEVNQQVANGEGCDSDYKLQAALLAATSLGITIATLGWALIGTGAAMGAAYALDRTWRSCRQNASDAIDDAWAEFRLDLAQCGFNPPANYLDMWNACYSAGGPH